MIRTIEMSIFNFEMTEQDWSIYEAEVRWIHQHLAESSEMLTGWLHVPLEDQRALLQRIEDTKREIHKYADVLVVIGVGGSFLGARAIQDALSPYFTRPTDGIEVMYVGQNMSGSYIDSLLQYLANKSVYVNVISKSGETMEPALAFRVLRQFMEKCYGEEAVDRIIVTTDAESGRLKQIADRTGYRQFIIPADIGGRYSVLTPVGLLPAAVAGVDIRMLMAGARDAALTLQDTALERNEAYQYAVLRHVMFERGYKVELLGSFEPALCKFHEWWMQLFGESEGKQRKGLFPATVNYSTDLHAIGQLIQEGSPILFETLLHFNEIDNDCNVPYDVRNEDGLNYLSKRTFNEINGLSMNGTALAHAEGGVPVIQLMLPKLDAYHIGYLIYFFMKACAMSASLLGVNPFDQPGVEAYKRKMLELLQTYNNSSKIDSLGMELPKSSVYIRNEF
ncbi:glucose-6-phosphate isomerase [Lysinibacillus xylanilyticus]|uniref:glucose-6-phosphate isomerase n=1 Tax=Lysinibacillus xylanilyticus TaxID=582475 RepID=UPI002B2531A2|nr:glucose-6-phosphate isomerase [Lysinibacillus xylanilyticus]MEB2298013.1 glucose-6-phosphate isomerase [Lysinibacillus xylanilyticus]